MVRKSEDAVIATTTTQQPVVKTSTPVPVSHNARDCMEDIGCEELYGNETVSVTGKTGSYAVNLYRTDDFF
jgi:hypothetical protein